MEPDVIDLVSSSPPPGRPGLPAANNGRERAPAAASPTRPGPARVAEDVVLELYSDDFDTTEDFDEPILAVASGNKRPLQQEYEPGTNKRLLQAPSTASKFPGPGQQTNSARNSAEDNIIELTSSPEINSTRRANASVQNPRDVPHPSSDPFASSQTKNTDPTRLQPNTVIESSDPFASSQPANAAAKSQPSRIAESSDPFASSQPKIQATERASATRPIDLSDPFASSPPSINHGLKSAQPPAPAIQPVTHHPSVVPRNVRQARRNVDWDPISSSAPEARAIRSSPPAATTSHVIDIESSSEKASDDELPDVADFDLEKCRRQSLQRSQSDVAALRRRPKTSRPPPRSIEDRTKERQERAAAKEADKVLKRQERERAKETKARAKERAAAMAEVNKLRTDKKVSTPEMMVDMPSGLCSTTSVQLETLLGGLDVQFTIWESPVPNVIKWRRKVRSRFNEDIGLWEPIPLRIEDESHAMVIMKADEFVNLAVADDLASHVDEMERHFGDHQVIYLLEGVIPWMRKNRNLRNRQFASHIRSQEPAATAATGRRRNQAAVEYIPEETIEDALLQLQVMHDVLVHHTAVPLETAQWVAIFTQHVSTIPYRKQRDQATLGAGFCMESGQVRTGDDAKDTYVRMLQEIMRVTAPIAYGIAAEFSNVTELVGGLAAGGPTRLEGVRKSANKDGAFSDRTVGKAVSRRVHKVFTGRDESSTDV